MKANSTEVIVGYYMLKDGTTVNPGLMTKEQKSQAIGIVAYLYEEHNNAYLQNGVRSALKAKGVENPHGLVIAFENAGEEDYEWSKESCSTIGYKTFNEQILYGIDGLEKTNSLTDIDNYPAFKAAKDYEKEVHAPKNTTGWYLPSIGEWYCMLSHYGVFSEYIYIWGKYWSSSGYNFNYAYNIDFISNVFFIDSDNHINKKNCVRPVLAF